MAFGTTAQLYVPVATARASRSRDYGQRGGTRPQPDEPDHADQPVQRPADGHVAAGRSPPIVDVATTEGGVAPLAGPADARRPRHASTARIIRIDPDSGAGGARQPAGRARRTSTRGGSSPTGSATRSGSRSTPGPASSTSVTSATSGGRRSTGRLVRRAGTPVTNFGWPCYEGAFAPGGGWTTLGNDLCDDLFGRRRGRGRRGPLYAYNHAGTSRPCGVSGGSRRLDHRARLLRRRRDADQTAYPSRYDGALFFVDYSRNCLAMLRPGADGVPDPSDDGGDRERRSATRSTS